MRNTALFSLLAAAIFLTGCSVLPTAQPDPSRYYVISTAEITSENVATPARPDIALSVSRVQLPAYLDRSEVVLRTSENRLRVGDTELWLEPLGKACTRVFSQDLARRIGSDRVAIVPSLDVYRDAVQVQVEIIQFDGNLGGELTLWARWRLARLEDGTTLFSGERKLTVSLADKPGFEGYVKGMSQALSQFSGVVAGDLLKVPVAKK